MDVLKATACDLGIANNSGEQPRKIHVAFHIRAPLRNLLLQLAQIEDNIEMRHVFRFLKPL
jgi:hypothetical protein